MQIQQHKGCVSIGGQKIVGHITDTPCLGCGQRLVYADKHDANFCPRENIWTDGICGDPACGQCRRRPEKPLAETEEQKHDDHH